MVVLLRYFLIKKSTWLRGIIIKEILVLEFLSLKDKKLMKTIGDTKVIGPLLIGLGLPIEIAPLRSSTSEILNLASIAAYSAEVIDYKK